MLYSVARGWAVSSGSGRSLMCCHHQMDAGMILRNSPGEERDTKDTLSSAKGDLPPPRFQV